MISLQNVSFSFGQKNVLYDINLKIKAGSLTALIGLNGAGKSTMFGCLSKQYNVTSGKITVKGKNIDQYSFRDYAKMVSLVPQLSSISRIDSKVRDFLVEGRTPYLPPFAVPGLNEYRFAESIASEIGISDYLESNFSKLSGGQQQMILLSRALIQDTPILLFDEPMSALDLKNQAFMMKMISKLSAKGKTILFSTHNPNHALVLGCDVILLHNGTTLAHDTAKNVLNESNLHIIFGDSVNLLEAEGIRSIILSIQN